MSKQLQRFDFGMLRDFRGPIEMHMPMPEPVVEAAPPPPPAPTFSEEQVQQARIEAKKLGFNEGFLAGGEQAKTEQEAATAAADIALQHIGEQIAALSGTYTQVLKQQAMHVSELALMIARKVADEALSKNSVDVIAALAVRCLPVIHGRPRITVELNPDTLPHAETRLREKLSQAGYEGEVQFRANITLASADARVDWGSGFAERNTDALWNEISLLLERIPLELDIPTTPTENAGE